jgi:hypothetical protein
MGKNFFEFEANRVRETNPNVIGSKAAGKGSATHGTALSLEIAPLPRGICSHNINQHPSLTHIQTSCAVVTLKK